MNQTIVVASTTETNARESQSIIAQCQKPNVQPKKTTNAYLVAVVLAGNASPRYFPDPSEGKRAGVDPFALWTAQRARRLRQNLYNLLRAAGPR